MTIQEKLKIIDEHTPKEDAKFETIDRTSLKITHKCGCVLVEHFAKTNSPIENQSLNKRFFITLCKFHENNQKLKL